ncbi:MAG: hypothetical protein HYV28_02125, partial [Ignavibacteriales bacterium]|nr:hypothetical protein [Ignavibacteriales bacterium]
MKKIIFISWMVAIVLASNLLATGLMLPSAKNYPKDFLRLTVNEVTVSFDGLAAQTVVYQEFLNEWNDSTDAVYSFPLPANARATAFYYWYNGIKYKAVLKVKDQVPNPGTGGGGIIALVNKYMGSNVISVQLKGIKAGAIQKVELNYIQVCDYYRGKASYNFPFNTVQFLTYPINTVKFTFHVNSKTPLGSLSIVGFEGYQITHLNANSAILSYTASKMYLDKDAQFVYETSVASMGVDFFSRANDSTDGHFALFVRPKDQVASDSVFKKCTVFLLSTNSDMYGVKLSSSVSAIGQALDKLLPTDYFNIMSVNYYVSKWKNTVVPATVENITSAKTYLSGVTTSYGSNMQEGVVQALNQIQDSTLSNSILIFSESGSNLDPKAIELKNKYNTGIFPIGIGDNVNRPRLEMTAALNYGFVTYISLEDNLIAKMNRVFEQIDKPILRKTSFEFASSNISQIMPKKLPSTYAGSAFYLTGRFKNRGNSPVSIAGVSYQGVTAFDFILNFGDSTQSFYFAEKLWAKEMIDALEQQIDVYGETPTLKSQLIALSLAYNIRCRY